MRLSFLFSTISAAVVEIPLTRNIAGDYLVDAIVTCAENITAIIDGKLLLWDHNYGSLPRGALPRDQVDTFLNSDSHSMRYPGLDRALEIGVASRIRYGDLKATFGVHFGSDLFRFSGGSLSLIQRENQTQFSLVVGSSISDFETECVPETLVTLFIDPTRVHYDDHTTTEYTFRGSMRFENYPQTYSVKIEQYPEVPDTITYIPGELMNRIEAFLVGHKVSWSEDIRWFENCDRELISRMPDITVSFISFDNVLSTLVVPPTSYSKYDPETNSCSLRFARNYQDDSATDHRKIIFNPLRLEGFNFRLDQSEYSVKICRSF